MCHDIFGRGDGIRILLGWFTKGYAFAPKPAPVVAPLPTPAELEQYAKLLFAERHAYEQRVAGEVNTLRPDTQDT